jgi:hypothetical protein
MVVLATVSPSKIPPPRNFRLTTSSGNRKYLGASMIPAWQKNAKAGVVPNHVLPGRRILAGPRQGIAEQLEVQFPIMGCVALPREAASRPINWRVKATQLARAWTGWRQHGIALPATQDFPMLVRIIFEF